MRFLIDESLPHRITDRLKGLGHEAVSIVELQLSGSPDPTVFEEAKCRSATLITKDLDFADIRQFPLGAHSGIIVVRMPSMITVKRLMDDVVAAVAGLGENDIIGNLVIVQPDRIRIRRKPK